MLRRPLRSLRKLQSVVTMAHAVRRQDYELKSKTLRKKKGRMGHRLLFLQEARSLPETLRSERGWFVHAASVVAGFPMRNLIADWWAEGGGGKENHVVVVALWSFAFVCSRRRHLSVGRWREKRGPVVDERDVF